MALSKLTMMLLLSTENMHAQFSFRNIDSPSPPYARVDQGSGSSPFPENFRALLFLPFPSERVGLHWERITLPVPLLRQPGWVPLPLAC